MKKIIALSSIAFLSTATFASADMQSQIDALTAKITKMEKTQKKLKKKVSNVNRLAAKDNIKWDVDFRTSYDNLHYETTTGKKYKNDALYSMRLRLGMGYAPTDDLVFKGKLSMNKAFGASYNQRATGMGFDTFDWVINEQLTDDTLRVHEAYWLWTPTVGDIGYTLSVGRRPATNGSLINLRDDDKEASPMGHVINMEFDGASASIKLDKYIPGFNFKLCLGRGLTNATAWANEAAGYVNPFGATYTGTPNYVTDGNNLDNTDMAGFIVVPYDDGQYQVKATWFRGFDVPGMVATTIDYSGATPPTMEMKSMGDMDGGAISFKVEGIGNEINDFLDNTILFASYAYSKSKPGDITRTLTNHSTIPDGTYTSASMLGSSESETGTSFWLGAQMPNLTGGQFGLEFNHGSKNWRPFTYGEDTMIGSKMATRGNAYEAYWTQPIVGQALTMQIRYTYLDYDYSGSNGFFGDGSTAIDLDDAATLAAMGMDPVETAQDIRVYFRYRY